MLIQNTTEGKIIIKYPSKFQDPLTNTFDSNNLELSSFEEYIWNLYTNESLMIQVINVLESNIDLIKAVPASYLSNEQKYDSIHSSGEFYVYLYKGNNNRQLLSYEDESYSAVLDKSLSTVFDENEDCQYFSDGRGYDRRHIEWLKLNKEDFYFYFNEDTCTFEATVDFKSLLNILKTSSNEIYKPLIKDFHYEYLNKLIPSKTDRKNTKRKI